MQRYFIDGSTSVALGDLVTLSPDDSRHFLRVMRAQEGSPAWLVSPEQVVYRGELVAEVDRLAQLRLVAIQASSQDSELPVAVTIAMGLSKNDKLDYIIQKGTECGAAAFQPLALHRDVVKWDSKKASQRLDRLQKIAKEAAEQCHRLVIPQVAAPQTLTQLLAQADDYDVCLVAYEEEAKQGERHQLARICDQLRAQPGARVLAVFGSEGGLTPDEVSQLQAAGFHAVGLGPRILRAETAPVYLLAALSYALELHT